MDFGEKLRSYRHEAGLSLAQLAGAIHYSKGYLSRVETGQRFPDRRFAELSDETLNAHGVLLSAWKSTHSGMRKGGEDPTRRREFIGAAGIALLALDTDTPNPAGRIGDALMGPPAGMPLPSMRQDLLTAERRFRTADYTALADDLSPLLATAKRYETTTDADTLGTVAEVYHLATRALIKLGDQGMAWIAADRGMRAAHACGDPVAIGAAARSMASMLHRAGRPGMAKNLAADTAHQLAADLGHAGRDHLSVYGALTCTGAVAAAHAGDRDRTAHLIREASTAARLLGRDHACYTTEFGSGHVGVYAVSAAVVLGDAGTAIEHARHTDPKAIPSLERRAAYWTGVARAFSQWGKVDKATTALLEAERTAPAEMRRQPTRDLVGDLLHRRGASRELRGLAGRIGAA